MNTKKTLILTITISLCLAAVIVMNLKPTGHGTYTTNDAELEGVNIAGTAEWEDYPGHRERHEPAKLYDQLMNYWWCSSDFNCSVTAYFSEPREINEIHIHTCNINKEKYIPKSFTIELNETGDFYVYHAERNNTYLTDYKLQLGDPISVSGVRIKDLHGNSFYGIGDYVYPCIEEVEIFKEKVVVVKNDTPVAIPVPKEEMSFWERLKYLFTG